MLRSPRQLWAAAAGCVAAFVALLVVVYRVERAAEADSVALESFGRLQRPRVAELSDAVAGLADPTPFAVLSALLVAVALLRRMPLHAAAAAVLLGGANISTQVLKPLLAHPRGEYGDYSIAAEAFPSGHATAAMSLAMAAVIVSPPRLRPLAGVVGAVFALAVSFSIVSLDWHFPSDIGGGFLVAGAWCFGSLGLLRAFERRTGAVRPGEPPDWAVAGLVLLVLVLAAAAVGASRLPELTGYAEGHTTFAVVAAGTALLASALIAAVLTASGRR